ncbi:MAG TPA: ComF family protein [Tepidimicrobium sp.]|nr:ComF family protein [Tepidimicrobium sp.]
MGIVDGIINLLFPYEDMCLFCKSKVQSQKNHICTRCFRLIEFVNRPVDLRLSKVASLHYAILYNRFVVDKLHAFKFRGQGYLHKPFGELLVHSIYNIGLDRKVDLIAFVPAHRLKESFRGYNQSKLLAKYVSEKLDIRLLDNHIFKTKWTKDQNQLDKDDRARNLKDCFESKNIEDFKGKEILLIDDIITTGTTMEECSKAFIESGANRVHGLALTSSRYLLC